MTIHPGPRNMQVILDTYMLESEIYSITYGLMPSLFVQNSWLSALFLIAFFIGIDFVSVNKTNSGSIQPSWPHA